jgi:pilus assembly protein Flp/PilA
MGWHLWAIGETGARDYDFWKGTALGKQCVKRGIPSFRLGLYQERRSPVAILLRQFWKDEQGQDIAEYAVMLAVILVIVVGTIRLIGSNANSVFSQVGSAIQ